MPIQHTQWGFDKHQVSRVRNSFAPHPTEGENVLTQLSLDLSVFDFTLI
jgi:hypothetical protein